MIKLARIPVLCGTLIFSMTGVASAQSVPFYPTARQTYYDVGIPGTYDHITASGHPEYNLNTEQQPGTAPVTNKKAGQHGCGSRCSYPDFGSIARPHRPVAEPPVQRN
jgi:hypothetical protein